MQTKLIGVKEFRQNLTAYHRRAIKNNWRYVVLNRNKPMFEVRPLSEKEMALEKLAAEIAEARRDVAEGRVFTLEQVKDHLGL